MGYFEAEIGAPAQTSESMIFQKLLFCTAALLVVVSLADLVGVALRVSWLTRAGAHLGTAGILLGAICLVPWAARKSTRRRGWLLWTAALMCFSLARWVRGSAGVPPDAPLIAAEIIGAVLAVAAVWRGRDA